MSTSRCFLVVAVCLSACASPPKTEMVSSPAEEKGVTPAEDQPPPAESTPELPNTCVADSDCVAAAYFDPRSAEGCCVSIAGPTCVKPVVTVAEAKRRRVAWEASCSSVRCPPSASCATGIWSPEPKCQESVCVDVAAPNHAPQ